MLASINANAVCTNATVKGVYDVTITNPDKTVINGAMSFDGLSNNFFPLVGYFGKYSISIYPNGVRAAGFGYYRFDSACKLFSFGTYSHKGISYNTSIGGSFTLSGAYAIAGSGTFNQAKITFKRR